MESGRSTKILFGNDIPFGNHILWKRRRPLCHPERSRGICGSTDPSWIDVLRPKLSFGLFSLHCNLDVRGHFAMQLDGHMEFAQLA